MKKVSLVCLLLLLCGFATVTTAAELPQKHEYQRTLRAYMATLTEKDFEHGVTVNFTTVPPSADVEVQYRHFLFTLLNQPLIGTKRGAPAVNSPAKLYLLSTIEQPKEVYVPYLWPETVIPLVQWNYAGNPYYNNRALKLRAFATSCVKMIMLDDYLETTPEAGGARSDHLAYNLIISGSPYPGMKDVLPPEVQKAYQAGLRKMAQRILDWGPEGEDPQLDMIAPIGLWYVSRALEDPEFTKQAEAYARRLLSDPKFFHPAGYCIDHGGVEMGYQGMANFFATWLALASRWDFAEEAVAKAYRLRAHLGLPEPNGMLTGPTEFNSRLSSPIPRDQWEWGIARDTFAALVTPEAEYLSKLPTAEELLGAEARQAQVFQSHLNENPRGEQGFIKNEEIVSHPWTWRLWQTYNFQASVNYGYEFYPAGTFARRQRLLTENSPLLLSPYLRPENFVRDFAKAFIAAKQPTYSAVLHTGPVGTSDVQDGFRRYGGVFGFGGGQLAAFWTPQAGSVLLARRGGMSKEKNFDELEQWRTWPLHAVSGVTAAGKVFTSARILQPTVTTDLQESTSTVHVSGSLPHEHFGQGKVLEGRLDFARVFTITPKQLSVSTTIHAPGQDKLAELYETLPVYLYEAEGQAEAVNVKIEFEVAGVWSPATTEIAKAVTAIRVYRNQGGAKITFDSPRAVKLSEKPWQDAYLTRAACQSVLVDLLAGETPVLLNGERTLSYTIEAINR